MIPRSKSHVFWKPAAFHLLFQLHETSWKYRFSVKLWSVIPQMSEHNLMLAGSNYDSHVLMLRNATKINAYKVQERSVSLVNILWGNMDKIIIFLIISILAQYVSIIMHLHSCLIFLRIYVILTHSIFGTCSILH